MNKDGTAVDKTQAAQIAFAQSEALGSSPHGAEHAAFVAKRTSPFFFSPRCVRPLYHHFAALRRAGRVQEQLRDDDA